MLLKELGGDGEKKYVHIAAIALTVLVLCILVFFALFRFKLLSDGFWQIIHILTPFFYGGVVAYLLRPLCKYFERVFQTRLFTRMKDRRKAAVLSCALSVTLSILLVLIAVFVLLTLTMQSVVSSIVNLVISMPNQIMEWTALLESWFEGNKVALNYIETFSSAAIEWLNNFFGKDLLPNLQNIIGGVSAGAVSVVTQFINVFIGLIVAIYLLLSRGKLRAQLKLVLRSIFPARAYDAVVTELRFIDRTFTDYISGRILDSLIVGVIVYIGCLIIGVQDAALIAVVNGLTNIIPYFGPYIGGIPSALLILMDDPTKCVWYIIFALILQQVDGNIICPKILSDRVGLSSFWVLFSTLLFGGLFGFIGLLVGVPVFVVVYDLIKKLIYWALHRRDCDSLIETYEQSYHPPAPPKKKRRIGTRIPKA